MSDDNEETALWTEYRRAQRDRRRARLPGRVEDIQHLVAKGFTVAELTPYHYRVDGALDLFPVHRRYHHLPSGKRGGYTNTTAIAVRFLRQSSHVG